MIAIKGLAMAIAATVGVLILSACGGSEQPASTGTPSPAQATTLRLSALANKYSPTVLDVVAGKSYQLEITDITEPHTFTVTPLGVNIFVSQMRTQTSNLTVPPTAQGEMPFFCSLHVDMGGTLRIQKP